MRVFEEATKAKSLVQWKGKGITGILMNSLFIRQPCDMLPSGPILWPKLQPFLVALIAVPFVTDLLFLRDRRDTSTLYYQVACFCVAARNAIRLSDPPGAVTRALSNNVGHKQWNKNTRNESEAILIQTTLEPLFFRAIYWNSFAADQTEPYSSSIRWNWNK